MNHKIKDENILRFGDCPCNDHREITMKLELEDGIQPIDIKTLTEVSKHLSDSKRKDSLLRGAFAGTGAELLSYAG